MMGEDNTTGELRTYIEKKVRELYPVVEPSSALSIGLFLLRGGYLPLEIDLKEEYKGNVEEEFKGKGNGVFEYYYWGHPAFRTAFTDVEKLDEVLRNPDVVSVKEIGVNDLYK